MNDSDQLLWAPPFLVQICYDRCSIKLFVYINDIPDELYKLYKMNDFDPLLLAHLKPTKAQNWTLDKEKNWTAAPSEISSI